jgi:death-on-curing protein
MGFGGVEFYPDVIDKAAVLCVRLARNHPLPDGNKRVAYLALVEFLTRNGVEWAPPSVDETVAVIEGVAAGSITERELPTGSEPRSDGQVARTPPDGKRKLARRVGEYAQPASG